VKTIGDAIMLRGSDPAGAIRLGLRIVDELEQVPGFPKDFLGNLKSHLVP
jgi:hypothetical protein